MQSPLGQTSRWRSVLRYITAQLLGAFAASVVLFFIYRGTLVSYETTHHITRCAQGSQATAMNFGESCAAPLQRFGRVGGVPFSTNGVGWLTVYVIAPIVGALFGGALDRWCFAPHYAASAR